MKTVNLGSEHSKALAKSMRRALRRMGARRRGFWWGLGGSQELVNATFVVRGQVISLERETYLGVTVSGPDELVDELVSKMGS